MPGRCAAPGSTGSAARYRTDSLRSIGAATDAPPRPVYPEKGFRALHFTPEKENKKGF
ncbi:hypothetical protein GCM10010449_85270 [Streptomyces rectiviolaceus]|uniref:Uncharacterized protein n=1 Tax=Streptomyces rectiviolaceus TaxID=332591 RepID=A0ABP6NVX3_9ACTN